MGEEAQACGLKHLKGVRSDMEKEFGGDTVLPENEAQQIMVGVSF